MDDTEDNGSRWLQILSSVKKIFITFRSLSERHVTVKVYNQETPSGIRIQSFILKQALDRWNHMMGNSGRKTVWRRKRTHHDLKHITLSVKHGGGCASMYACQWSRVTGVFSWLLTAASSRRNSELAQIHPNAAKKIGRCFTVQMDSNPKHTAKTIQDFLKAKKRDIIQLPRQSPDLNPAQQLETWGRVPLLQPPSAGERKHLVTSIEF